VPISAPPLLTDGSQFELGHSSYFNIVIKRWGNKRVVY
jgi:hypothetical protein